MTDDGVVIAESASSPDIASQVDLMFPGGGGGWGGADGEIVISYIRYGFKALSTSKPRVLKRNMVYCDIAHVRPAGTPFHARQKNTKNLRDLRNGKKRFPAWVYREPA